jgi:protein-arginine kinase activator protein McsA
LEIRQLRQVEKVVGYLCDVCHQTCHKQRDDLHAAEYGILRAEWGYWSSNDQTTEECHLCEACFAKVKNFILSLGGNVRRWER